MSPPIPSIPERVDALEVALALHQARRLALLIAIRTWLASPDVQDFEDLMAHLEERIQEEGP